MAWLDAHWAHLQYQIPETDWACPLNSWDWWGQESTGHQAFSKNPNHSKVSVTNNVTSQANVRLFLLFTQLSRQVKIGELSVDTVIVPLHLNYKVNCEVWLLRMLEVLNCVIGSLQAKGLRQEIMKTSPSEPAVWAVGRTIIPWQLICQFTSEVWLLRIWEALNYVIGIAQAQPFGPCQDITKPLGASSKLHCGDVGSSLFTLMKLLF